MFFVRAGSSEAALAWGRFAADRFVAELWAGEGATLSRSWGEQAFASWLEHDPKALLLEPIAVLEDGVVPDVRELRRWR